MVTSNTNPPELKLGQGVLHGGIYPLNSGMVNRYNLTPTVEEVMEFQRELNVKIILENFSVWKSVFLAPFEPLEQILSNLHNFCIFAQLYNKSWGANSHLGVRSNLTPINSKNLLTETIGPHYMELENLDSEILVLNSI
jgi:hypothetical protein